MESPYFTNPWVHPSHRRHFRGQPSPSSKQIPVHPPRSSPAQKVVEIPVQYISSKPDRFKSAVKIQKVFRGYLVRKNVKKIDEIRREVVEIEEQLMEKESVEVIKSDNKERLRLNERLMSLLFKLDSVLGVDSSVKELRKRVIKRVIRLQEIVDDIVLSHRNKDHEAKEGETVGETVTASTGEAKEDKSEMETTELDKSDVAGEESRVDVAIEENSADVAEEENNAEVAVDKNTADMAEEENNAGVAEEEINCVDMAAGENDANIAEERKIAEVAADSNIADEAGCELNGDVAISISEELEGSASQTDSNPLVEEEKDECEEKEEMEDKESEEVAENKRNRDLLERMVEDNEKMMGLVAELFERNEMQTRLLSALSHRVGQLEKAFMCERLRKKKNQVGNGYSVDCNKKCGVKKE